MDNPTQKYIVEYIIGVMRQFNFNTNIYPPISDENSLLWTIEQLKYYSNRSGYIYIGTADSLEYVSGNNPALAVSWDMSRPNIRFTDVTGELGKSIVDHINQVIMNGGGYLYYPWIDPRSLVNKTVERAVYTQRLNQYLDVGSLSIRDGLTQIDYSIPIVMTDILQQLISNYIISNAHREERYPRFLSAIQDGRVVLISMDGRVILGTPDIEEVSQAISIVQTSGGGPLGKNFVTKVPFLPYIVWYMI